MSKFKESDDLFIKSIKVNGKEAHDGAPLQYLFEDDCMILKTEIGKTKKQKIVITIASDDSKLIVDEEKTSSD